MSQYWGIAIPGIAMQASELPDIPGLLRLENPEVGTECKPYLRYTLEDIAEKHTQTIQKIASSQDKLICIGMSLGAMILAIMATKYSKELPNNTQFRFLVTSANTLNTPIMSEEMLNRWLHVDQGDFATYENVLSYFFSETFKELNHKDFLSYVSYRAAGDNNQSARAFLKQLKAMMRFDGEKYFAKLTPNQCVFIGSQQDHVLGPKHSAELKRLCPKATHVEVSTLGHMVNLEAPELFSQTLSIDKIARL